MKKLSKLKKIVAFLSAIIILLSSSHLQVYASEKVDEDEKYAKYIKALDNYTNEITYSDYLENSQGANHPEHTYIIQAVDYLRTSNANNIELNNYEGEQGKSLFMDEEGFVEWEVEILEDGLYNMSAQYYPVEGKSSDIQRALMIDGKLPFSEASIIEFNRFWVNEKDEIQSDNQGNQIRPRQIEKPQWEESTFKDQRGFYRDNFQFYFSKGKHTITFISQREAMVLKNIKIFQEEKVYSYEEVLSKLEREGATDTTHQGIQLEAEKAIMKSSPMLYPSADYSSIEVLPYSPSSIKINTIGGSGWKTSGQWIQWEVDVPETGFYSIGMNVKQNFVKGTFTSRRLYIDGKVPFKEVQQIPFHYKKTWRQQILGDETPYKFYLTEGKHTIKLEVVLGEFASHTREVETCVRNLNDIYRRVIMVTGVEPDQFRDYQLEKSIPGLADSIYVEQIRLQEVAQKIRALTGGASEKEAVLNTVAVQLEEFHKDVEKMTFRLKDYKTNIGALGTWMLQIIEQPLQLDALYICSPGEELPKIKDSFWDRFIHAVKMLFYSFIIDYNTIGNVTTEEDKESITVWVGTGRDQANTMKALIDESFTQETGIGVNLMLVDMTTLLQATLSGQGPDVAMQVGSDIPMNYAMRGAITDLTQFEDFNTVKERFYDSAMVPFEFNEKSYALPETQTFNMLFYRKDILQELDLEVPKTWDEVKVLLSVLSKSNMQFGMMPQPLQGVGTQATDLTYGIFLYQMGGQFYTDDAKASALDTDIAINAFKEWTKYYTDYTLEREFDFVNRFRTGEMPIGISDYGVYNTLQVSAPEIKGLWGFTSIPGTVREDGTIDKSVPCNGSAVVIMDKTKNKDASWEFLKWWTSDEIQTKYGREMEGLMGAAARYPTANTEALSNLSWPVEDYKNISAQFEDVKGIPQIPGGYYTSRNIYNAFTRVVVDKKIGPRESLMDYVQYINDEIKNKRKEFGLEY